MLSWLSGKKQRQKGSLRIEDYALIGDCETAALVSREGSIDWLCWPNFSSGACFAALLGTRENGFWELRPADEILSVRRRYRSGTLVVESTFTTKDGEVCLIDFMPPRGKHSDVIRIVEGVSGKVKMRMELVLRFDYGLTVPWVTIHKNELRAISGPNMTVLRSTCNHADPAELHGEGMSTVSEFTVKKGEHKCFTLSYAASTEEVPEPVHTDAALADTQQYWMEWAARGKYRGPYEEAVQRSLLTLKAMTYRPSGGIVAAVTAGLPEEIGGERNWDYRYCWLRDTSLTLLVLMRGGYVEEAIDWRLWLLRAIAGAPDSYKRCMASVGSARWWSGCQHGWLAMKALAQFVLAMQRRSSFNSIFTAKSLWRWNERRRRPKTSVSRRWSRRLR